MRVLVVDAQSETLSFIDQALRAALVTADLATSADGGLFKATVNRYSAIVLAWHPTFDGLALCREMRRVGLLTPIIMLNAEPNVRRTVVALEAGSDDCMTKPIAATELVARLHAIVRRDSRQKGAVYLLPEIGLKLSVHDRLVWRDESILNLTRREFDLLQFLIEHEGEIIDRERIWECVWGWDDYPLHNTVEVHVRRLRIKLDDRSGRLLQTLRGLGYRFQVKRKGDTMQSHGIQT